jgi:hypothetical protein
VADLRELFSKEHFHQWIDSVAPISTPNVCDNNILHFFGGAVQAVPADCCASSLAWFPYVI